ncbi:MAG: aminotransferase class [Myxococcales bacterium]|nr:aminotransferase class [Myxococcales bacterium]
MARFPELSVAGNAVPASIFSRLREHLARFPGDVIPFQIGDTHLSPPARLEQLVWAELAPSDLYAYGAAAGWQPLVKAIAEDAQTRRKLDVTPAGIQVTSGATHALASTLQALCDPGDELLILTPHWPLIRGIALSINVIPVEVPYFDVADPAGRSTSGPARLEAAITPRTAAIYLASPNNPDGTMLGPAQLAEIADIAERHNLWILSDEVYEHYAYEGPHVSMMSLPAASQRTVTVFSFAKSYALAGLRVGYALTGNPKLCDTMRKMVNHSVYNVPVAMQHAALAALREGAPFVAAARERYRAARDRARARLAAPTSMPSGGAYLWVDFGKWIGNDCMPLLEKIAASGVLLAPGSSFGAACGGFARLCFTGVNEARLDEGIDRINAVLAAWS